MNDSQFTLGRDYEGEDPLGWFVSEKLDGCRAYWDGRVLWSRGGGVINAPAWFTAGLPKFHLDSEIYAGRGKFEVARLAVQTGRWIEGVHQFHVFDAPEFSGDWSQRMTTAATLIQNAPHARTVAFGVITDRRQVFAKLQEVQSAGGEGLMLRHPDVQHYETGRTANLLKVKLSHPAFFTLEFIRTRHHPARRRTSPETAVKVERKRNNQQHIAA